MRAVFIVLAGLLALRAIGAEKEYQEVEYNALRISLEDYKGKEISYVETWRTVSGTVPKYMELSGLRPDKYLLLVIGDLRVPVLVKKTDELVALVAGFQPGDKLRVTGEVRRFSAKQELTLNASYYVLADSVELVAPVLGPRTGTLPDKRLRRLRKLLR